MRNSYSITVIAGLLAFVSNVLSQMPQVIEANPKRSTSSVTYEAADAAIWIDPTDPAQSLILGVDIGTYPKGGLYVWDISGNLLQHINISHPSNVDVRYGLQMLGESVDFAAVTMRDHDELRIFKIDPITHTLTNITTDGNIRTSRSPFRLTLYKRPSDNAIFAIISNKPVDEEEGTPENLWQFQLEDDGTGKVKGTRVRVFGDISGVVQGMAADDELGYLYVAEENTGIHKYYANPERGDNQIALFATNDGISGSRASVALYTCSDNTGYILVSVPAERVLEVYRREGDDGNPNSHSLLTTVRNRNGEFGKGLDITNQVTSPDFPFGCLVWYNKAGKQFRIYGWEDVAKKLLKICEKPKNR